MLQHNDAVNDIEAPTAYGGNQVGCIAQERDACRLLRTQALLAHLLLGKPEVEDALVHACHVRSTLCKVVCKPSNPTAEVDHILPLEIYGQVEVLEHTTHVRVPAGVKLRESLAGLLWC